VNAASRPAGSTRRFTRPPNWPRSPRDRLLATSPGTAPELHHRLPGSSLTWPARPGQTLPKQQPRVRKSGSATDYEPGKLPGSRVRRTCANTMAIIMPEGNMAAYSPGHGWRATDRHVLHASADGRGDSHSRAAAGRLRARPVVGGRHRARRGASACGFRELYGPVRDCPRDRRWRSRRAPGSNRPAGRPARPDCHRPGAPGP
jgi:hypothetical protein